MESKDTPTKEKEQEKSKLINSDNILKNLKSDYFIQKFFDYIQKRRILKTIRYNKSIQKRINLNINHYKEYSEKYSSIEIEIKPMENKYGLFYNCKCIESICFKKFYRNNVTDMSFMFRGCSSLKELNLNNFNTINVTNMSYMFYGCSSLKELNLNNFNTNNVTDMSYMFSGCSSLKELNLNNFNTNNVTYMRYMFDGCSSLKELNLNNFNTNNV